MSGPIISVRGIVLRKRDNVWHTLLLKRAPSSSLEAGFWECPGGQLEGGLGAAITLYRELDEECGLFINMALEGFVLANEYTIEDGKYAGRLYLSLFQVVTVVRDTAVQLSTEHDDHLWLPLDQLTDQKLSRRSEKGFRILKDRIAEIISQSATKR